MTDDSPTERIDDTPFADDDWGAEVSVAEVSTNQRVPVILLLDTSGSMSGAPIRQLNEALQVFQNAFDVTQGGDAEAARSAELSLITFGDNGVQTHNLMTGSGTVSDPNKAFVEGVQFHAPTLRTSGGTPLGPAMTLALQTLEQRKQYYRANSIPYYRPMMFLISDGAPDRGWQSSASEAVRQVQDKHVLIYPIGVEGADLETLSKFSTIPAMKLQGLKFTELFQFISNSIGKVSRSDPGTQSVAFDQDLLSGWVQAPITHD